MAEKQIKKNSPTYWRDVRLALDKMLRQNEKLFPDKTAKNIKEMQKLEKRLLPQNMDYNKISGLRIEARQKLTKLQPASIGQASRISGVSPADIAVLLVQMEKGEINE